MTVSHLKTLFLSTIVLLLATRSPAGESAHRLGTFDDLKKLDIICFVPSWLPKDFKVTRVQVSYDESGPDEGRGRFPVYQIDYAGPRGATFTIDSAREGIGDRNLMDTDDADEATLHSALFGDVLIIYTPKGKSGVKKEVIANWVEDANMKRERERNPDAHPNLGRFHGFSATGITVNDFQKIIDSLHPVRS